MTKRQPTNMAASVKARLLAISKARGEDFTLTLVRYAAERFLYRLSQSEHASSFIKNLDLTSGRIRWRRSSPRRSKPWSSWA